MIFFSFSFFTSATYVRLRSSLSLSDWSYSGGLLLKRSGRVGEVSRFDILSSHTLAYAQIFPFGPEECTNWMLINYWCSFFRPRCLVPGAGQNDRPMAAGSLVASRDRASSSCSPSWRKRWLSGLLRVPRTIRTTSSGPYWLMTFMVRCRPFFFFLPLTAKTLAASS